MTVFLPKRGKTWRYDFWYEDRRYTGNTKQTTREDAEIAEREVRLKLRHQAGGISQFFPQETPRFQDWARIFVAYKAKRLTRPDHMQWLVPVLLRFFGAPGPDDERTRLTPFHDLRLGDLIAQPERILEFEDWMKARGLGPQSRNHYRGFVRRMYALAMKPEFRKVTGIAMNPMTGVENDPTEGRTVTLTPDQIRAWIAAASYHVRVAISIGMLAHKLRLRNILNLRWTDIDPDPRTTKFSAKVAHYIRVFHHKTAGRTKRPLVTPVSEQLLRILKDAHTRAPGSDYVVTYRGQKIERGITGGVRAAAQAANIPYGMKTEGGATFHTLRHSATTLLSEVLDDPLKLMDAAGHTDFGTTLRYRHAKPKAQRPTVERLSKKVPLEDLVTVKRRRVARKGVLGPVQESNREKRENSNKTATWKTGADGRLWRKSGRKHGPKSSQSQ